MEYLTKTDLLKLSMACKRDYYYCREIMADNDASDFEKSIASFEADIMVSLLCKLDRIADSKAKRIEIRG